jgi:hypothetical protein
MEYTVEVQKNGFGFSSQTEKVVEIYARRFAGHYAGA